MTLRQMGKKRGMMQIFKEGRQIPCTVIEIEPNVVTQIKTEETDGYPAIQLSADKVTGKDPRTVARRSKKPQRVKFEKLGIAPRKRSLETRLQNATDYSIGQEFGVDQYSVGQYIDITGTSKGKGYQGVMKKYNFAGGAASHGASVTHRHAGSTGMRSTPGRCLAGSPRASHMGDNRVTVQNLEIVEVIPEEQVILVKGAVPGPVGADVTIAPAVKRG